MSVSTPFRFIRDAAATPRVSTPFRFIRDAAQTPRVSTPFRYLAGASIPGRSLGPGIDGFIQEIPSHGLGPGIDGFIQEIPSHGLGPGVDGELIIGEFMGIRAKQMQTGTFDATTEGRAAFGAGLFDNTLAASVFAAGSIPGSKLASGEVNETALATSVAGNGLTGGGGAALAVQPNTTDDSGVPGIEVAANGARLSAAAAGAGLAGGAGDAMSVGAGTGIAVNANDVALALATGTPTYSGTHVSTHTVGTLQVTGTPDTANDPINKAALDSAISGLTWKPPVHAREIVGSATIATINGLSPSSGDAYIATDAGTPTAGTSDALVAGSMAEYDGTQWKEIVAGSGGFVPVGFRALAAVQTALNGTIGLVDSTDDGKILEWDGTTNTPAKETPVDQWAVLITDQDGDGDSIFANLGYTYQGAVPTGSWNQFTGAGQINAGAGLTKDGNTLDVGSGNGITVAADEVSVDVDSETGGNIQGVNVTANGVGVDIAAIAGTGIEADGSANLRLATQGNGIAGGNGSTLSVDAADASIAVGGGGINVNPAALIQGGAQEVDADLLDIDYAQTNYTPATTGVATDVNHLSAHLEGIDDALGSISVGSTPTISDKELVAIVTSGDGSKATNATVTTTPVLDGYVGVKVNGIGYVVGDGVKTKDCYFSVAAGGGAVARSIADIVTTDELYWNGAVVGFELDTSDIISLHYDV